MPTLPSLAQELLEEYGVAKDQSLKMWQHLGRCWYLRFPEGAKHINSTSVGELCNTTICGPQGFNVCSDENSTHLLCMQESQLNAGGSMDQVQGRRRELGVLTSMQSFFFFFFSRGFVDSSRRPRASTDWQPN